MSGSLKVNTDQLRSAGAAFVGAADKLAAVQVDAPLGDAAAAVTQLQTAEACTAAKAFVATEMSTLVDAVHTYGSNLGAAAGKYESTDRASGEAIRQVDVPPAS